MTDPCTHEQKIPHRQWDTGAWRWTCSHCYIDLPKEALVIEPKSEYPPYGWCSKHSDYHHCPYVKGDASD